MASQHRESILQSALGVVKTASKSASPAMMSVRMGKLQSNRSGNMKKVISKATGPPPRHSNHSNAGGHVRHSFSPVTDSLEAAQSSSQRSITPVTTNSWSPANMGNHNLANSRQVNSVSSVECDIAASTPMANQANSPGSMSVQSGHSLQSAMKGSARKIVPQALTGSDISTDTLRDPPPGPQGRASTNSTHSKIQENSGEDASSSKGVVRISSAAIGEKNAARFASDAAKASVSWTNVVSDADGYMEADTEHSNVPEDKEDKGRDSRARQSAKGKSRALQSRVTQTNLRYAGFGAEETTAGEKEAFCLTFLRSVILSQGFEMFVGFVILSNFVAIAIETDQRAVLVTAEAGSERYNDAQQNLFFIWACNLAFLGFYICECIGRLYVMRWAFFQFKWNHFDVVLIIFGVVGELMEVLLSDSSTENMTVLRSMRMIRLLRASRILISFQELYALICGLSNCMKTLSWAISLVFMLLTIWSIIAVEYMNPLMPDLAARGLYEETGCSWCPHAFSNILHANLTFFQMITGDGWSHLARPLIENHPWTASIFIAVIFSMVFGLLNLITAVIVDTAMSARQLDIMNMAQCKKTEREEAWNCFTSLCVDLDQDQSGDITYTELSEGIMNIPELEAYLSIMGVEKEDLSSLFELLDSDGDGFVTHEEFAQTLYKIKTQEVPYGICFIKHMVEDMRHQMSLQHMTLQHQMQVQQQSVEENIGHFQETMNIIAEDLEIIHEDAEHDGAGSSGLAERKKRATHRQSSAVRQSTAQGPPGGLFGNVTARMSRAPPTLAPMAEERDSVCSAGILYSSTANGAPDIKMERHASDNGVCAQDSVQGTQSNSGFSRRQNVVPGMPMTGMGSKRMTANKKSPTGDQNGLPPVKSPHSRMSGRTMEDKPSTSKIAAEEEEEECDLMDSGPQARQENDNEAAQHTGSTSSAGSAGKRSLNTSVLSASRKSNLPSVLNVAPPEDRFSEMSPDPGRGFTRSETIDSIMDPVSRIRGAHDDQQDMRPQSPTGADFELPRGILPTDDDFRDEPDSPLAGAMFEQVPQKPQKGPGPWDSTSSIWEVKPANDHEEAHHAQTHDESTFENNLAAQRKTSPDMPKFSTEPVGNVHCEGTKSLGRKPAGRLVLSQE